MSTYSNRLYDHFQRERSAFVRSLLAVLSIAVFFTLVFQPYLVTLADLVERDDALQKQAQKIAVVQRDIQTATAGIERATNFMGDASAYQALYEEADAWVDDLDGIEQLYDRQSRKVASLRSALHTEDQAIWQRGNVPPARFIVALHKAHPDMMASYEIKDDCFFRLEDDWVRCFIDSKLAPIHQRLERVLYDRTESHDYTRKLETSIRNNREKYVQGLVAALGQAEPAKWVRSYLEQENNIIRRWYEETSRKRLQLLAESKEQQRLLIENEEQIASLEDRKKEIGQSGKLNTPVGSLPLAFLDTLTLLPLILLATGIMLLRSQSRLLELHQKFQRYGPDEETGEEALRLTLPMWLSLNGNLFAESFVMLVFLLPGMAALFGIEQLASNPGLKISASQLNVTITVTLVVAAVYAFQYVKLFMAWLKNRSESE